MIGLDKVLVVDDSKIARDTLCSILAAHCDEVIEADGVCGATEILKSRAGLSLVICESSLSDGDPGDLLMALGDIEGDKPNLVVIASRPDEEEARRFEQLGATAYLSKPISFVDLSRALRASNQRLPEVTRRIHSKPVGTALVFDDEGSGDSRCEVATHLIWDIDDLSVTGAFLETHGPVRLGRELSLGIVLESEMVRVQAQVVRLLEPSWDHVSGIGVTFIGFAPGEREKLEAFIARRA